jgi:hypothetical protein
MGEWGKGRKGEEVNGGMGEWSSRGFPSREGPGVGLSEQKVKG